MTWLADGGKALKYAIDPDIQALAVSRQRKLQLQLGRLGLCRQCGRTAEVGAYCLIDAIDRRERQRFKLQSGRRNKSKTYRMEAAKS